MSSTMLLVFFSVITTVAGMPTGQPTSCCKYKTVGGISYTFSRQMDTAAFNCISNCAYHRDGDTSVQYCFAKGDQDAVCTDDQVEENANANANPVNYGTGILITGGTTPTDLPSSTEVWLPGTGLSCFPPDLPDMRWSHTLDMVPIYDVDTDETVDTPVLCGGGSTNDTVTSCLQFWRISGYWSRYADYQHVPFPFTKLERRSSHTSWVSPLGLVLIGGWLSPWTAQLVPQSIEHCCTDQSYNLMHASAAACSVQVGDSTIITGGLWYHDLNSVTRWNNLLGDPTTTKLPNMTIGRYWHGCGTYSPSDSFTLILVVAGGRSDKLGLLRSTEQHIIGSSTWTKGQPLPTKHGMTSMASASLGTELYMFGGFEGGTPNVEPREEGKKIFKYNGSWKEVGKLQIPRFSAAAIVMSNMIVDDKGYPLFCRGRD